MVWRALVVRSQDRTEAENIDDVDDVVTDTAPALFSKLQVGRFQGTCA